VRNRCQQQRHSRKRKGDVKWTELELWPTTDPVTGHPAVLVSQNNITQVKKV
jgi:hypothetical protein